MALVCALDWRRHFNGTSTHPSPACDRSPVERKEIAAGLGACNTQQEALTASAGALDDLTNAIPGRGRLHIAPQGRKDTQLDT